MNRKTVCDIWRYVNTFSWNSHIVVETQVPDLIINTSKGRVQ